MNLKQIYLRYRLIKLFKRLRNAQMCRIREKNIRMFIESNPHIDIFLYILLRIKWYLFGYPKEFEIVSGG